MNVPRWMQRSALAGLAGGAVLIATFQGAGAATAPSLGTAESFVVLAGTTVTNTGPTTLAGDLGVSPGSEITDSGTITLTGATHIADATALQAQNDVTTAYNSLGSEPCTSSYIGTAVEIGGQTLSPGVYCYSSSALLTGTLVLDGDGVYIFKMGSTLTTVSGSTVALIGAQPCNVFWQVGSSADLFTNTTFVGNILALTSINLQTGTTIAGRALARNGAVTLDTNTVTASSCAATATPTSTPTATATPIPATATPIPATATSIAATATAAAATATSVTATETSVAATATAAATGVATPPATPTRPSAAPPASPIETPAFPVDRPGSPGSPGAPRLPNAGAASPPSERHPWGLALSVSVLGGFALAAGIRTHQRSRR